MYVNKETAPVQLDVSLHQTIVNEEIGAHCSPRDYSNIHAIFICEARDIHNITYKFKSDMRNQVIGMFML